jgi:hypothetical protein
LKYLVIAALAALVFILVYSRLRPYLQLIQKVVESLSVSADQDPAQRKSAPKNKLVRCESCGTWVPADRALKLRSGLATYCSRECLEKPPSASKQKLAG